MLIIETHKINLMKFSKFILLIATLFIVSCGSSERIIGSDGTVYEVKGDTFIADGKNVTETLTSEEKTDIRNLISEREKATEEAERLKKDLEKKQKELERAEEEAKRKQKELEEKQEALERKLKAKEEARENFLKTKEKLRDEKKRYEKLKKEGKLSPNDDQKWQEKLKELEIEVEVAKKKMDELNKD